MNDYLLTFADPVNHCPGFLPAPYSRRNHGITVGQRGTDDGYGKTVSAEFIHQQLFTGDFIPGILPIGVGKGGGFGDEVMLNRLLVRRGRTDEEILPGPAGKQGNIPLNLVWSEGDPVNDSVKLMAFQGVRHAYGVGGVVRLNQPGFFGNQDTAAPPV
jgi:hypothetical protein